MPLHLSWGTAVTRATPVFLFTFVVFFSACRPDDTAPADTEINEGANDEVSAASGSLRFLALGDSYTIGESVAESGRWPMQLSDTLNARLTTAEVTRTDLIATTGWTTFELDSAMDLKNIDTARYDLVSLLIGVNNQYRGLPVEDYADDFRNLLERAIVIAGGTERVFVVSIPDYGYTPFGEPNQASISSSLDVFNDTCRVITTSRGVAHYNITPISRMWPDQPDWVAEDGLHPSAQQYTAWVQYFADSVAMQLGQ